MDGKVRRYDEERKAPENEAYNATEIKVTGTQNIPRISWLPNIFLVARRAAETAQNQRAIKKAFFKNGLTDGRDFLPNDGQIPSD